MVILDWNHRTLVPHIVIYIYTLSRAAHGFGPDFVRSSSGSGLPVGYRFRHVEPGCTNCSLRFLKLSLSYSGQYRKGIPSYGNAYPKYICSHLYKQTMRIILANTAYSYI